MSNTYEIRWRHFKALLTRLGRGGQAQIARATGLPANYVSRLAYPPGKAGRKRIGDETKWLLDAHYPDWMDDAAPISQKPIPKVAPSSDIERHDHLVPVSNATGSMGYGAHQPDQELIVDNMRVTRSWIRTTLPGLSAIENLAVLTARGDSMEPTLQSGDLVLVDRGIREVAGPAIYVVARDNEVYIKRIIKRIGDGALLIRSDNPAAGEAERIENGNGFAFEVLGRVVWAWRGKEL